jgi:HAD superfamily hydrolase (TIGR01509 family)
VTGKRTRDLVDAFRIAANVPHALDHLLEVRHKAFREALARDPPRLLPGAGQVLREAAARGPVCLVTSGYREDALATLDALGVRGRFKDFVTGEDVEMPKPHPEPYQKAAARMGVLPVETLAFEDSGRGVAAAKAAGCRVVAVPNPRNTPREAVAAADVILGSLEEALPLDALLKAF